ncbi:MAG: glycosyltransferase family 39 protein [Anaerolineales bacterium]|nr:glycosyltransferase family 39 protein [Anaerolineales bacterium]
MTTRFVAAKTILFSMLLFQIVWLAGIWLTGSANDPQKLLIVAGLSVLAYLLVSMGRESIFEKIGNGIEQASNNPRHFLALLAIVLLFVGVYYASWQRAWPFDEVQNFNSAFKISEKGWAEFFAQYAKNNYLANRHPPLIFMINGLAMSVFGERLMTIRMVTLVFGYGMFVSAYFLAADLYGKKVAVLTVLVLISFPLILRESTAGLLDIQATLFFVLSLWLALKLTEKPSWKWGVALGLSLGLGLLTKYMVMLIIPLLLLIFLVRGNYRAIASPVVLSFLVASVLFLFWAWFGSRIGVRVPTIAGFSPSDLFTAVPVENVAPLQTENIIEEISISPGSFLFSDWGRRFLLDSLITKLPSGLGAYNLPLLLLGLFLLMREKTKADWFLGMWIGVISLLLVLTLPDHRYFMVIFPALAMIGAKWLDTQPSPDVGRISFLLLAYQLGSLYIFIDWRRASELFLGS